VKFLSIDIETTGLNPLQHSMTEFAAVFTDLRSETISKAFYRHINPENFVWSQYCLGLHGQWLSSMLEARKQNKWEVNGVGIVRDTAELINEFCQWLWTECNWPVPVNGKWKSIVPAGKNFNSFDRRFLEAANFPPMFKHRALDPAMLYTFVQDEEPPSLELCKKRAMDRGCVFKNPGVAHNALEDADDVALLLQHGFR
jgi:oligoribonuclease